MEQVEAEAQVWWRPRRKQILKSPNQWVEAPHQKDLDVMSMFQIGAKKSRQSLTALTYLKCQCWRWHVSQPRTLKSHLVDFSRTFVDWITSDNFIILHPFTPTYTHTHTHWNLKQDTIIIWLWGWATETMAWSCRKAAELKSPVAFGSHKNSPTNCSQQTNSQTQLLP